MDVLATELMGNDTQFAGLQVMTEGCEHRTRVILQLTEVTGASHGEAPLFSW